MQRKIMAQFIRIRVGPGGVLHKSLELVILLK